MQEYYWASQINRNHGCAIGVVIEWSLGFS